MIGRFGGVISAPFAILPVRTCGHSRLRLTIFTYARQTLARVVWGANCTTSQMQHGSCSTQQELYNFKYRIRTRRFLLHHPI